MRIAYVVGARPNIVKMAPVVAAARRSMPHARHIVIHTGQHYDDVMSEVFVRELGMQEPDYDLEVGSGSHAKQTARAMERIEAVLEHERPELVLVPGDVNSTLAAALVAAKLQIPLAHVEAGLRSFDRTMPEEVNRIVADEFSDYLFTHSEDAIANLRREGITNERIHHVGNTMIDTLVALEERFRGAEAPKRHGVRPGEYLLVTLHRPAVTDDPALLARVLAELASVAEELPVLFPMHPRTRKAIGDAAVDGVRLVDPLGYVDFLSLEADAAAVLTDSGGVQEETTYLRVPCFTLRDNTERPVTVTHGTNTVLGLDPSAIRAVVPALGNRQHTDIPPYWDGRASERIAAVLVTASTRRPSCGSLAS